jgi:hypothetical protein
MLRKQQGLAEAQKYRYVKMILDCRTKTTLCVNAISCEIILDQIMTSGIFSCIGS